MRAGTLASLALKFQFWKAALPMKKFALVEILAQQVRAYESVRPLLELLRLKCPRFCSL
jgi:hypothetical protein